MNFKRILIVSDLHCGHRAGLTPPGPHQIYEDQAVFWNKYKKTLNKMKPFDICICNGDAIDGLGDRSGGTEQVTTDRLVQVEMAAECLTASKAKQYFLTHGTRYHVGSSGEDLETILANRINGRVESQLFLDVYGVKFHIKHKIAASSIPHGRFTPLARQKMWNLFWSEFDETPKVNIFIRSHVHYFEFCGGFNWYAMTTPALQTWGTKYGKRDCEGTIDWGLIVIDVFKNGNYKVHPIIDRGSKKVEILKV